MPWCETQSAVNARIVYGNLGYTWVEIDRVWCKVPVTPVQYVYGIRYVNPEHGSWIEGHKDWPACYFGITLDARSWSRTEVYALSNFGPFYDWWEWFVLVRKMKAQQQKEAQ
jgi:hypothetical protein